MAAACHHPSSPQKQLAQHTYQLVTNTLKQLTSRQMEMPVQGRDVRPVESEQPNERWQAGTMELNKDESWIRVNLGYRVKISLETAQPAKSAPGRSPHQTQSRGS